jgi:CRISPR-associated protein Cas8a1/Csx13
MAKAVKARKPDEARPLAILLHAPGMTPLLRAGAGGLAASLRALLLQERPSAPWPSEVRLGPGSARVEPHAIHLDWGGAAPEQTLQALFQASFRLSRPHGLIDLPGTRRPGQEAPSELAAALQDALSQTFLQHGQTRRGGTRKTLTFTVDGEELRVETQGYESFVHQEAWQAVLQALRTGSTPLAGWAYPGAAERHIGLGVTKVEYTAEEALCACFAPVGCLTFKLPQLRGGALVALAPADLVRFAEVRPALTPRRLEDVAVAGVSDAVLAVQLAFKLESGGHPRELLSAAEAVALRPLPWNMKQKVRFAVVRRGAVPDAVLDRYEAAAAALPNRLRVLKPQGGPGKGRKKKPGTPDFFVATSALRAFITENLAADRPWYTGFATATTADRRFIHQYRTRDNLGALLPEEKKGLIAMHPYLEEAEQWLVQSVHTALRQRLGRIAEETEGSPLATRHNRMDNERERLRLKFAGAKTPEQMRAELADLWSRAGPNRELQAHWRQLLPLLGPEHWRAARDLALVALASYQGRGAEAPEAADDAPPPEPELE